MLGGSEFSLLTSPPDKTLLGRLPFPAGDPAPPIEAGLLLSPATSIDEMYLSNSSRFSLRCGVGDVSCGLLGIELQGAEESTSLGLPILCRLVDISLERSSLCLFSSASFAFFAKISSLRCCIIFATHAHILRLCFELFLD